MTLNTLLITANVGSIFEDIEGLSLSWTTELLSNIIINQPKFIALHCQEFGGKNYEKCMTHIHTFVKSLLSSSELSSFHNAAIFIDEDFSASDKFTALGNLYFIHDSLTAKIWNFQNENFESITGHQIYSGNIENNPLKIKMKFPQNFFPDFKWSRKGFMMTRWSIEGITMNFTNVHLYHDESNFVALTDYPSQYVENRRAALEYTLEKLKTTSDIPQFYFGDFNFRLDLNSVVRKLINDFNRSQILSDSSDCSEISLKNSLTGLQISIRRKHFSLSDKTFFNNSDNLLSLLEHDKELQHYDGQLFEMPINFVPSYPFTEERNHSFYMPTRCPAWCDRVLMNLPARQLLDSGHCNQKSNYDLLGLTSSMGDHKPVYLMFELSKTISALALSALPLNSCSSQTASSHSMTAIELTPTPDLCEIKPEMHKSSNRDHMVIYIDDNLNSINLPNKSSDNDSSQDSCNFCFCSIV